MFLICGGKIEGVLPVIVPVKNFIPFIITISASWNVEYNDKHHILNNNVRMIFFHKRDFFYGYKFKYNVLNGKMLEIFFYSIGFIY